MNRRQTSVPPPSGPVLGGAVTVAVLSVSTAAILFRLTEAPPLSAAFHRLLIATILLAPVALYRHRGELAELGGRDWLVLGGVGVALGVHFGAWVPSLELTSVAASVVLVTIHPVFVGAWSHLVEREGPGGFGWVGILLALAGGAVIALADASLGGHRLLGDLLAVLGALMAAVYFLAGRRVRRRLSNLAYVTPVYTVATVVLLILALVRGESLAGYRPVDYAIFAALAVVPMILGHTLLNWSLAYVRASVVSVSILGEPLGSALLAWLVLTEIPPAGTLAGGTLVLAGIVLVVRDDRRARRDAREVPGAD